MRDFDAIIVGGGFYGGMLASHLANRHGRRVLLAEKHADLLTRASFANQARVHQGYHYPRSLLTGLRSRENFARFAGEFAECVSKDFRKVYAVPRRYSKVTAGQFDLFCRRIGAPIAPAPADLRALFDPNLIEDVFLVEEYAFDAVKLRERVRRELEGAGVEVRLNTTIDRVKLVAGGLHVSGEGFASVAGEVYNCTYSELNRLFVRSGLPVIPLKHEIAEMALMRVPPALQDVGVTVMCGPFFSCMPFPSAGLHTLSHVRYTPHTGWTEDAPAPASPHDVLNDYAFASHWERMVLDASRYVPLLKQAEYVRSIREVKTVLPINEADDGRPILFRPDCGLPGLHALLGAKIDNIYDILDQVDSRAGRLARVGA